MVSTPSRSTPYNDGFDVSVLQVMSLFPSSPPPLVVPLEKEDFGEEESLNLRVCELWPLLVRRFPLFFVFAVSYPSLLKPMRYGIKLAPPSLFFFFSLIRQGFFFVPAPVF